MAGSCKMQRFDKSRQARRRLFLDEMGGMSRTERPRRRWLQKVAVNFERRGVRNWRRNE